MQKTSPPNSVKPIRLEKNNHVTTRISPSVESRVMNGAYRSIISLGLLMIKEDWKTRKCCNHNYNDLVLLLLFVGCLFSPWSWTLQLLHIDNGHYLFRKKCLTNPLDFEIIKL